MKEKYLTDEEKDIIMNEVYDYEIKSKGQLLLDYFKLKLLKQEIVSDKQRNPKLLDFNKNKNYMEELGEFFASDRSHYIFVYEFEEDLSKIWGKEDVNTLKDFIVEDFVYTLDEIDESTLNEELDQNLTELKELYSQYDKYDSVDTLIAKKHDEIIELIEELKNYQIESFISEVSNYSGSNDSCLSVIEVLKKMNILPSNPTDFKSPQQPE